MWNGNLPQDSPQRAADRRRGRLVPFEEAHSRKRVPSTTPLLFALRFEPANQNCACPKLPPVPNCHPENSHDAASRW